MNVTTNHLTLDMYILHSHKPTSFLKQVRQAYEVPPRLPVSPPVVLLCACPVILPPSMVSKPPFQAHLSSIHIQLSCLHNIFHASNALKFHCAIKKSRTKLTVRWHTARAWIQDIGRPQPHTNTLNLAGTHFREICCQEMVPKKYRTLNRMLRYIDLKCVWSTY